MQTVIFGPDNKTGRSVNSIFMANIITSQDLQKKTAQKAEELSAIESAENKEPRYAIEYLPGSDTPGMQEQLTLLPSRFTSFIYSRRALPLKIGLMTLVFITALYTKVYTGEYQHLVNNHLGGVFYVLFGSLALSALFPKMKMYLPVVLATGVTCLLEFVQGYQRKAESCSSCWCYLRHH